MIRFIRVWIAALMLIALVGTQIAAATVMEPAPHGTTTIVADGAGDRTLPHINGTLATWTHNQDPVLEVHYYDLATGAGGVVPGDGFDRHGDVFGNTIIFTRTHDNRIAIHAFDVLTGSTSQLDPQPGSVRAMPAVGGATVAWEDRGPVDAPFSSSEIVVYDRTTQSSTRLTNDDLPDLFPSVSSDGSVVVWEKCGDGTSVNCDVWQATFDGSTWTTTLLAGGENDAAWPATNGDVVVYQSTRDGETDLFWQPVGGGTEQQLSLPGIQQRPSISGDLVSFETEQQGTVSTNSAFDIMTYDLGSDTIYPVTETLELTETLSDISVSTDGVARVIYTSEGAPRQRDIHVFTFDVSPDDMTSPILALPGDISADATGPEGAVVEYAVTAEDDIDDAPVIDCTPPSGSVFPIGVTTVNCTATDSAGNGAEGSFTIIVQDADEQIEDLAQLIESFDLGEGTEESLDAKLGNAGEALEHGQVSAACGMLGAFINSVEAQAGKSLTHDQASNLIDAATRIRSVAGCV